MNPRFRLLSGLIAPLFVVLALGCSLHKDSSAPLSALSEIQTPRENRVETLNGYRIEDPYRWLEDGAKAKDWIEKQNQRTLTYLEKIRHPGVAERVRNLFGIGYVGEPQVAGNKVFYLKLDQDGEQPRLVVLENGTERILVDPGKIDPSGKTALDWYYPSRAGRMVAYGLSKNGDEISTLYLLDVASGAPLADTIPFTQHCSLVWLGDESGFFYTRYKGRRIYNRLVYFHAIGADPHQDSYIFGRDRKKTDWTDLAISNNDRYLFLVVGTGSTTDDAYAYDLNEKMFYPLAENLGARISPTETLDDRILALTTHQAPNGRLVLIDPKDPDPDRWREVLAERPCPIKDFRMVADKIVAHYLQNASSRIRIFDLQGSEIGEATLPAAGTVGALRSEPGNPRIVLSYSSFLYPDSLFALDATRSFAIEPLVVVAPGGHLNPADFVVESIEYPSYDGTPVPLFIVHHKNAVRDGSTPTLLTGYGGFGIERGPYFSRTNLFWIERGGVFAMAGIRGGGEKGETWHEAGMREKKFQVFEDFEYAMRYLIRTGYTRPEKLAIRGGSNGGLLIGAMVTRNPHLFNCAVGQMGLYDMVRYHQFPPGELWVPEYGSADHPEQTGYLWAYSPYHQVLAGVRYPATFLYTAESDTRVPWLHTAKFAAALQNSGANQRPILFLLQRQAGHGQGMNQTDVILETAQMYDFILEQIGDPDPSRSVQK